MACDSPFYVLPRGGLEKVPVPCGRCPPCKLRRVNGWVFRLLQEEKRSTSAYFLTLTYDTSSVPITEHGFMTLSKTDLQKYFKRLRKIDSGTIKYYAVGEYGSLNNRPHYHAIIFGVSNPSNFSAAWALEGLSLGAIQIGTVTGNSIAYTLKYIDKPSKSFRHSRDDRQKEFSLMSKRLGDNYLTPEIHEYHCNDLSRMYLTREGGHTIAMPRYYRNKLFDQQEQKLQCKLAASASVTSEDNLKRQFSLLGYKDFTYEQHVSAARYGRHRHFYSSLTKRNL